MADGISGGHSDPLSAPLILLNDRAAALALGVCTATLWRGIKDGRFPGPIRIGGCTRWVRGELIAAIEAAQTARDSGEVSDG